MTSADAASPAAPTKLNRSSFFILIAGLLANAVGQAFIFAILPPLGREVALSEVQTTSIISTSALVFTFLSLVPRRTSPRRRSVSLRPSSCGPG